jgi:tetratricopeptide (TPR) repeat protein
MLCRRFAAVLCLLSLLAACQTAPRVRPVAEPRAVSVLLDDARRKEQAGRLDLAAAALERALRVAPRNPMVWHRLADLRLRQARYHDAETLALRSNSLPAAGRALTQANWKLIAKARSKRGDHAGARDALRRAGEPAHY